MTDTFRAGKANVGITATYTPPAEPFDRGAEPECEGCAHKKAYRKYYCGKAIEDYCDAEELCQVEERVQAARKERE